MHILVPQNSKLVLIHSNFVVLVVLNWLMETQ
jgi:hypothetical protein